MSWQPTLWDSFPKARSTDPVTSHEAAERSRGLRNAHQALILGVLRVCDVPLTAEAIAVRCRMRKEQVGRRMGELLEEGVVVVGYGMTSTGRRAQAYRLACGH